MLVTAVFFWQVIVAVHIVAVVIAFGLVIVYPFIALGVERVDPRGLGALHRTRQQLGRLIVNPGLALVLVSGIYLASDLHDWKQFFTQWGLAMVIVLGGLEGAVVMRLEGKLADMAEAESAGGGGTGTLSAQYTSARVRSQQVSWLMAILVIITIYLMATGA
jgi:hypothetical protein